MAEYILDLRKTVGHRPLLQVGASVILADNAGRILLELRADNDCWGYPGGSMELGEDTETVAKRELYEETGLRAHSLELFGVFSGEEMHYIYPNGDEVYNVDVLYVCREWDGELCAQAKEVKELRFFSVHELPERLSPPHSMPLKRYIESLA